MEPLLYLAHRLPYPPNKGDKVRSHHFLRHLASRYRVYLGTFIDQAEDWLHLEAVRRMCAEVHVEPLVPWSRRAASSLGLLRGEALTLPYFRSAALRRWIGRVVQRERIAAAFAFSSPMAQYLFEPDGLRSVVDFVDMDSAKWGEYAARRRWPLSALYRREERRLLAYEQAVAARADATIFVTERERKSFVAQAVRGTDRVITIRNGVDGDYFSPAQALASPFAPDEKPVVFTGAMDYWPNIDAVVWFAREVLPRLRRQDPAIRFYVVGMNPGGAVRALAGAAATVVTGRVPDVRPYLRHARLVVAPLRVARGIQNKELEAMAKARPVVATPACAAALSVRPGTELEVAGDAESFGAKVLGLMEPARAEAMGRAARRRVLHDYAWQASFDLLDQALEGPRRVRVKAGTL